MSNELSSMDGGMISAVVKKLTPRLLAITLTIAMVLLAVVIGYALNVGGSVDLKNLTFKAPERHFNNTPPQPSREVVDLKNQLGEKERIIIELSKKSSNTKYAACTSALANSLSMNDLAPLLGVRSTTDALAKIREMSSASGKVDLADKNLLYKLYRLETIIPEFGKSISTKYSDGDKRTNAFILIQDILRELDFYQGESDGDQIKTNKAVVDFQSSFNQRINSQNASQKIKELGSVGYKTLEAMRSAYRQRAEDA